MVVKRVFLFIFYTEQQVVANTLQTLHTVFTSTEEPSPILTPLILLKVFVSISKTMMIVLDVRKRAWTWKRFMLFKDRKIGSCLWTVDLLQVEVKFFSYDQTGLVDPIVQQTTPVWHTAQSGVVLSGERAHSYHVRRPIHGSWKQNPINMVEHITATKKTFVGSLDMLVPE